MSGTTTRLALPYPEGADGPDGADVPYWMQALAVALDGAALDDQGILADRPVSSGGSPGIKGRYYMVKGDPDTTQNGILWRDNGTGWDAINIAANVLHAADKSSTSAQSFAGGIVSTNDHEGIGYDVGAGGAVTQTTSKSHGVTLNKITGKITMHNASLAAGASVEFTVSSTAFGSNDGAFVTILGTGYAGKYRAEIAGTEVFPQQIVIRVTNVSGSAHAEAIELQLHIIRGAAS